MHLDRSCRHRRCSASRRRHRGLRIRRTTPRWFGEFVSPDDVIGAYEFAEPTRGRSAIPKNPEEHGLRHEGTFTATGQAITATADPKRAQFDDAALEA